MKISVLIATYNGSRFIEELLDSLIQQTDAPDEIVVCDDCSTDTTIEIIEKYRENSKIPLLIYRNEKNKGYRLNFFDGLDRCAGDYVAFCDQDDVWLPEKIKTVRQSIEQNKFPGLIFSDCLVVDEKLKSYGITGLHYCGLNENDIRKIKTDSLIDILIEKPCVTGMTMVCKKASISRNFPEDSSLPHDYLISFAFSANSDYKFIEEPLILYRQHENNIIGMSLKPQTKIQRRPSIFSKKYKEALNRDIQDKISLINYSKNTSKNANQKINQAQNFYNFRMSRRLNFINFFKKTPEIKNLNIDQEKINWMLIKDLRCYLRLRIHLLLDILKTTK